MNASDFLTTGALLSQAEQISDLQAKVAFLRKLCADRDGDLAHEFQRANAAEAENARLRAALQEVEYADYENRCPWCLAIYGHGHAPNCARQIALGLAQTGVATDANNSVCNRPTILDGSFRVCERPDGHTGQHMAYIGGKRRYWQRTDSGN